MNNSSVNSRRHRYAIRASLLAIGMATGIAGAQQVVPDNVNPARDTLRRQQDLDEATRLERGGVAPPARRIEYDEVLAQPDDINLNFGWAQTQVSRGDIKGAANTLERMLLTAPNEARVRLLYAVVLFRLERLDEAERELLLVRGLPMEPALRAEIDRYRREIEVAKQQTRFTASISMATQYDWNRNSSPRSGEALLFDTRLPVAAADRRKSDWQLQTIARIEMTHDIGGQDNDRLNVAASYVRGEQAREDQFDFQVGSVEFGGAIDFAPTWVVPTVYARRLTLGNQRYGRIEGGNLRVEQRVSGRFTVYGFSEAENQTYASVSRSTRAPERSGVQVLAGVGASWIVNPSHRLNFELGPAWKNARESFESYRGVTSTLTHTWLLGQGIFLVTALGGDANFYDEPEQLVSTRKRQDRIARVRTTLGVPLGILINDEQLAQSVLVRDITMFVSLEGIRARSTLTNNAYDNHRVAFGVTKRWDF